jgi:hypothetical protein
VNVTLAVVEVGEVALPIVGAVEGPLVAPAEELRIGMYLFYLTLKMCFFALSFRKRRQR